MKTQKKTIGSLFKIFLALGFIGALGSRTGLAQGLSWAEVYENKVDSVVVVLGRGVCAGSLVGEDLVLTAWHCVSSLRTTFVRLRNPEVRLRAQVIDRDSAHDLALLRLERPMKDRGILSFWQGSAGSQDPSPLREGDPVATIGHPMAMTMRWLKGSLLDDRAHMISAGIVSKINDKNVISDLSISPGNSGGPLLNEKGEMVGMASAKLVGLTAGQIGYFTPIEKAQPLMEGAEKKRALPWWLADNSHRFFVTYVSDPTIKELGQDLNHWGLEWSIALRDRWRWSLGSSRWGSNESLTYWRTGYIHRFLGQGLGSMSVDLGLGGNHYYFSTGEMISATTVALGIQLRTLRVEIARPMDSGVEGTSLIFGLGLGG